MELVDAQEADSWEGQQTSFFLNSVVDSEMNI